MLERHAARHGRYQLRTSPGDQMGKGTRLAEARGTNSRGRKHVSWAESLGDAQTTHRWNWAQHGAHEHTAQQMVSKLFAEV